MHFNANNYNNVMLICEPVVYNRVILALYCTGHGSIVDTEMEI